VSRTEKRFTENSLFTSALEKKPTLDLQNQAKTTGSTLPGKHKIKKESTFSFRKKFSKAVGA